MTHVHNMLRIVRRHGALYLDQIQRRLGDNGESMRPILRFNDAALFDDSFPDRVFDAMIALHDPNLPAGWALDWIPMPAAGPNLRFGSYVDLTRALRARFHRIAKTGAEITSAEPAALTYALGWDAVTARAEWDAASADI